MDFLKIGILGRPHGLRGDMKATFDVDGLNDLDAFSEFYVRDVKAVGGYRPISIENVLARSDYYLVHLSEVNNRDEADRYRQTEIWVDKSELPTPGENEYYYCELEGSDVLWDENPFGKVESILEIAGCYHMMILKKDQKRLVVPIKDRYFDAFDRENRQVKVLNIEELL